MSTPTLPEIREAEARGSVALAYAAIRRALAVEMVVLYYRVLAAEPGRLERVWAALGPNLGTEAARSEAAALTPRGLVAAAVLTDDVLRRGGLEPARVRSTVEAFDRANRLNLVALAALLDGAPGDPSVSSDPAVPVAPIPALPPVDLGALEPRGRALLERMSASVAGTERPILVPTMFRVFAGDPATLEALWDAVGRAIESPQFGAAVADLVGQARRAAARLPLPVPRESDAGTRAITKRFTETIPAMIVVGDLVRSALEDRPSRPSPGAGASSVAPFGGRPAPRGITYRASRPS
jgi:hypothetical protein